MAAFTAGEALSQPFTCDGSEALLLTVLESGLLVGAASPEGGVFGTATLLLFAPDPVGDAGVGVGRGQIEKLRQRNVRFLFGFLCHYINN